MNRVFWCLVSVLCFAAPLAGMESKEVVSSLATMPKEAFDRFVEDVARTRRSETAAESERLARDCRSDDLLSRKEQQCFWTSVLSVDGLLYDLRTVNRFAEFCNRVFGTGFDSSSCSSDAENAFFYGQLLDFWSTVVPYVAVKGEVVPMLLAYGVLKYEDYGTIKNLTERPMTMLCHNVEKAMKRFS